MNFEEFPKMPRLSREIVITEKIDGTNAQILLHRLDALDPIDRDAACTHINVGEAAHVSRDGIDYAMFAGSRTRWISPGDDNFGFAAWAFENKNELSKLGEGRHFGEWWGAGIQRRYGLSEKRFSLFNTSRWSDALDRPACCHVVPTLYRGNFDTARIESVLAVLAANGSLAAPGFMNPEGIVVFHMAGRVGFKKTIDKDDQPKSLAA